MAWALLTVAGLLEIAFAFGMKSSDGFTRLMPALFTVVTGVSSVFLLSLSLRTLPVGTGYAVWTGIGAAGTDSGNSGAGRLRRAAEAVLHCSHFGGRYRPQVGFGRLILFGAFFHPVTAAGGAEVERKPAEMSQDFAHGRGTVAAATTEQCEVAL